MKPLDGPKFAWRCSYQGSTWFDCWDETGQYELELRRSAEDYERKCYNGDDADWQRNVVDMIGVLRRSHNITTELPCATFHSFNAWLISEHVAHCKLIASQPERYGANYKPAKPHLAKSAARWVQTGYMEGHWIITANASATETC